MSLAAEEYAYSAQHLSRLCTMRYFVNNCSLIIQRGQLTNNEHEETPNDSSDFKICLVYKRDPNPAFVSRVKCSHSLELQVYYVIV